MGAKCAAILQKNVHVTVASAQWIVCWKSGQAGVSALLHVRVVYQCARVEYLLLQHMVAKSVDTCRKPRYVTEAAAQSTARFLTGVGGPHVARAVAQVHTAGHALWSGMHHLAASLAQT